MWTPPRPALRSQPSPAPFPQITLGRATKDNQIDVDLSLEGPAWKISRKQGASREQWEAVPWPLAALQPQGVVSGNPWDRLWLRSWCFQIPHLGVPAPSLLSRGSRGHAGVSDPLLASPHPITPPFLSVSPGVIKLKNNGDFFIANEGRRPIYIDGRPVLCGSKWRLSNNSVVEVSPGELGGPGCTPGRGKRACGPGPPGPHPVLSPPSLPPQIASLRFVFLINQDLIALIRAEAAKITPQ